LLAGTPRRRHLVRSIRPKRASHTPLAATWRISMRCRIPKGGSRSSRCRFPPSDVTVFCRGSFSLECAAQPESPVFPLPSGSGPVAHVRWLTPCALRLREPHRTARPLTPFVSFDGATARPPMPRVRRSRFLAFARTRCALPIESRTAATDVGLVRQQTRPRAPSISSMLDLSVEWSDSALTCSFARNPSAPFHPPR
jgi:hypothetical protein